jgi:hypothetical protein
LQVRGFSYSRSETPVKYWIITVISICGTAMIRGIGALFTAGIIYGWI